MKIGCVKEIKNQEYRVGLTPSNAKAYTTRGHKVFIEKDAGADTGFDDSAYTDAGAEVLADKQKIFDNSDMIVKVKEPQEEEFSYFHEDQILYTYLHLAAEESVTKMLMDKKVKGVAYETIELPDRSLPCLTPMSEIAGRLSVQEGAKYLEKTFGGRGILLGGVPGVSRGKVGILGGGVVGTNAAKIAVGIGADVTILDVSQKRMGYLDDIFYTHVTTLYSNDMNIEKVCAESDVIIGAVLLPGAKAPCLISRDHLKLMKKGAVVVDVAIDQGGCMETSKATTHDDPIYVIDDVVHYCVANMPGAVALSSTVALTSTTLPYGLMIAEKGLEKAVSDSEPLRKGVNTYGGCCVYKSVADDLGLTYTPLEGILK